MPTDWSSQKGSGTTAVAPLQTCSVRLLAVVSFRGTCSVRPFDRAFVMEAGIGQIHSRYDRNRLQLLMAAPRCSGPPKRTSRSTFERIPGPRSWWPLKQPSPEIISGRPAEPAASYIHAGDVAILPSFMCAQQASSAALVRLLGSFDKRTPSYPYECGHGRPGSRMRCDAFVQFVQRLLLPTVSIG